jgi:hypothetical protein
MIWSLFLKLLNPFISFALINILFILGLFCEASAAEKRDGLLISVGGGMAHSEIIFESDEGTNDSYTSKGFAFSARLGWCFNEHFLLYWDIRESAYFSYNPDNNDTYHAGLWTSIGSSYYINKSPDSFYLTGAVGLGDLETGKFNSDAIVGTGISYLIGSGYIIRNKVGIELDWMKTDIGKNDSIENDFTANSFRLIIYWQFL